MKPTESAAQIITAAESLGNAWAELVSLGINGRAQVICDRGRARHGQEFLGELEALTSQGHDGLGSLCAALYALGRAEGRSGVVLIADQVTARQHGQAVQPGFGQPPPDPPMQRTPPDYMIPTKKRKADDPDSGSEAQAAYSEMFHPGSIRRRELVAKFEAASSPQERDRLYAEIRALDDAERAR
jgi:hypothetical protein